MEKINNNCILLVEDAFEIQFLLKQLFEGEGYEIECADNGQEALDLLHKMKKLPAFILLDFMMPVMNGIEFRKEQIKDPKLAHIPVIVMTADNYIEDKSKNIKANGFIKKPAEIDQLLDIAKQFCN